MSTLLGMIWLLSSLGKNNVLCFTVKFPLCSEPLNWIVYLCCSSRNDRGFLCLIILTGLQAVKVLLVTRYDETIFEFGSVICLRSTSTSLLSGVPMTYLSGLELT